jgi:hypothetical protein
MSFTLQMSQKHSCTALESLTSRGFDRALVHSRSCADQHIRQLSSKAAIAAAKQQITTAPVTSAHK